jgi:hypothetical protein
MDPQVTSGSSQVTSGSTVKSQTHVPSFAPRPRQDPAGMSALFIAVTIVCALGATAIVTTAGRDGSSFDGWTSAVSEALRSIGRGAVVAAQANQEETLGAEREMGEASVNIDFLGTIVRDHAKATNQEFARVYDEISTLKAEVSVLRETTETKAASTRNEVGTLRANVNLLQTSLDELSLGRDSETDRLNKRLAKIEDVISIRADVTASIPRQHFPPMPRRRAPRAASWTAEELGNGYFVVKGPTGRFEVTVGSVVPGLGRIEAVRHQDGKLRLVTKEDDQAND